MVVGRSYRGRETPCVLWRRFVPYLLARTSPLTTKTGIYGRVLGTPMLMLGSFTIRLAGKSFFKIFIVLDFFFLRSWQNL